MEINAAKETNDSAFKYENIYKMPRDPLYSGEKLIPLSIKCEDRGKL